MKELFVLAWHSYAEIEDVSEGGVIGIYTTLEEAQQAMKDNVEESASYYDDEDTSVSIGDTEATLTTINNYFIKYYIDSKSILLS